MFLETLTRFIEDHREYLDDWLFLLLLRLLNKQGSDMPKSVQYKIQLVLEHVRYRELLHIIVHCTILYVHHSCQLYI